MQISELRAMDDASLAKRLDDLEEEMFKMRFQRAAGQLANFNRLTELKRDIARVKTLLRERVTPSLTEAKNP